MKGYTLGREHELPIECGYCTKTKLRMGNTALHQARKVSRGRVRRGGKHAVDRVFLKVVSGWVTQREQQAIRRLEENVDRYELRGK